MSNVEFLPHTYNDIDPDHVLDGACGKLDVAVVIGYGGDEDLYIATSTGDTAEIIYLLERAKRNLMDDE